jgi:hypothetical protein
MFKLLWQYVYGATTEEQLVQQQMYDDFCYMIYGIILGYIVMIFIYLIS